MLNGLVSPFTGLTMEESLHSNTCLLMLQLEHFLLELRATNDSFT
jgi:hypothetical protein